MKLLVKFFLVITAISVFPCQENKTVISQNEEEIQEIDSPKIDLSEGDIIDPYDEELEILIEEAKGKIKNLIKENKNEELIKYNYERKSKVAVLTDAALEDLNIKIEVGNLFTENDIHAVLYVSVYTVICVYHYDLKSDTLQTVLYIDDYPFQVYSGDTIQDVNGDNKKDFIIKGYPTTGCCIAELRDVYLFQNKTAFTEKYHFMNPTFYPKEKVIRGLTYSWNPSLYKYKWNGLEIDTIEHIASNIADTTRSTFFKTKKWEDPYDMENVKKIKLNSIPKEYHSIDNFDVFEDRNLH